MSVALGRINRGFIRNRGVWLTLTAAAVILSLGASLPPAPSLQMISQPLAVLLILQSLHVSTLRKSRVGRFVELLMMVVPFALLFAAFSLSPTDSIGAALIGIGWMLGFYVGLAIAIYSILLTVIAMSERLWLRTRAAATRAGVSS